MLMFPLGTVIKSIDNNKILFELENDKQEFVLLSGGRGGKGNAFFKTPTRQTQDFHKMVNQVKKVIFPLN